MTQRANHGIAAELTTLAIGDGSTVRRHAPKQASERHYKRHFHELAGMTLRGWHNRRLVRELVAGFRLWTRLAWGKGMSHYLSYWRPATVATQAAHPLDHSASNQYGKTKSGDVLWIVTSRAPNDLLLVGRLQVQRVVGQQEAAMLLGTTDLWDAEHHVIGEQPQEKASLDISPWAHDLEFDGVVKRLPERFTGQHLQALRRLTDGAAVLLERIWVQRRGGLDHDNAPGEGT